MLENYNYMTVSQFVQKIIQLSELLENYNDICAQSVYVYIIQLSELLENYNDDVKNYQM